MFLLAFSRVSDVGFQRSPAPLSKRVYDVALQCEKQGFELVRYIAEKLFAVVLHASLSRSISAAFLPRPFGYVEPCVADDVVTFEVACELAYAQVAFEHELVYGLDAV